MELTLDNLREDNLERARIENKAILDELERKKRARAMAVPTDDTKVKARLREVGEPITLFGERAADRRDRLIYVLSVINAARGEDASMHVDEESSSESEAEEEFYTQGSFELLQARRRIAEFSLPRAQQRVAQQRIDCHMDLGRIVDIRKNVFSDMKAFTNLGSQIGDERPISMVRFAPNSQILAAASWSGSLKLWNVPACTPIKTIRGHSDRIGGLAWHPGATGSQSSGSANIVTGGGEGDLHIWSLDSDSPLATLKGHLDRVCRVAFHPSGNYVASASYDTSWRLWDVATSAELMLQEGHSKEVYAIDFQDDGALLASGGLDAIGRVWDLRTGRTAMVLDGHVQPIYTMNFSPNGYQVATGAGDDTIRLWDMRNLKAIYTIPAHMSNVADIRFFRGNPAAFKVREQDDVTMANGTGDAADNGEEGVPKEKVTPHDTPEMQEEEWKYRTGLYFVSGGYDGMVKLWSADDWQLLKSLSTDAGKVMSVDLSGDGNLLVSGTYNRNFQLFGKEEF